MCRYCQVSRFLATSRVVLCINNNRIYSTEFSLERRTRTAGKTKRDNLDENEELLLMKTLRDMNLSKLIAQDVPLFLSLLADLFPTVVTTSSGDSHAEVRINSTMVNLVAVSSNVTHLVIAGWMGFASSELQGESKSILTKHSEPFPAKKQPSLCERSKNLALYRISISLLYRTLVR